MNQWKTWAIAALIVLVGAGVFLALRMRNNTSQSDSLTQIVAVQKGDLVAAITPTGEVSAERRVQLGFNVSRISLIELHVTTGQQVKQGDVLARIDTTSLERAVEQAAEDLLSAEEALEKAKQPPTELDTLKSELAVVQAEAALEDAKQALDALLDANADANQAAVRKAELDLQIAQINLTIARHSSAVGKNVRDLEYSVAWNERQLRDLEAQRQQGHVTEEAVDKQAEALAKVKVQLESAKSTAETALAAAQDQVTQAEEALAKLKAGSEASALTQARYKVALAEYNLAQAQDNLASLLAGPDAKTVQLAQQRYDAAKATLDEAKSALEAATLTAPFDGTVISVGAQVGDLVSSNTTVVTLADLSNMRVLANVDETDISKVEVGQDVLITFDAFAGYQFWGKVLEVPLEGNLTQNVVRYQVVVSLPDMSGIALRSGMTANLTIVVGYRENVLLVPILAVRDAEQGQVVILQDSLRGSGVTAPVEVGLNDGTYVEVTKGVQEGDHVLVEYQPVQQQTGFLIGTGVAVPGRQEFGR
jgi:HlyD family secretion protein